MTKSEFTPEDGIIAVKAARSYAEAETGISVSEPELPDSFNQKSGVFVTINRYPSGDLRGCIGYPEPFFDLRDALGMAARSACHDPRFIDLSSDEVYDCTFEVTILTPPEEVEYMDSDDLISKIVIGRDGLIMEYVGQRGLLLPQVASELGWDAEEFLNHLSIKTGFPPKTWRNIGVRISMFSGEVYSEIVPYGEIRKE